LVLAYLVDRHDVWVVEAGRVLGLSAEALYLGWRGESARQNNLQGDGPIERDLPGLEDDSHAPASDLLQQFIIATEARAVPQRFGRERLGSRWAIRLRRVRPIRPRRHGRGWPGLEHGGELLGQPGRVQFREASLILLLPAVLPPCATVVRFQQD